jgi:predicted transcriptional regulator
MEIINSEFISRIAELIIKEPSSLEIMLMLNDEGPKTVEEISVIYDTTIKDLLSKLEQFKVICSDNDLLYITSHGRSIVKKLREKNMNRSL